MKIAILGFGREGRSLLKFLRNRGLTRLRSKELRWASADNDLWILDKKTNLKIPRGVHARLGKNYLKNLEEFDVIFRSPGIPYNLPELARARRAGLKISSATKLFFDETKKRGVTIIGITGSKGKTTTATLLYRILKAAHKDVYLAGNVGKPTLAILQKIADRRRNGHGQTQKKPLVILELSSFQLQDLDVSPHIAVVLDVFPEHQDSHASLSEYYGAKAHITRHQKKGDKVFFLAANRLSRWIGKQGNGEKFPFHPKNFRLFAPSDVRTPGMHTFHNVALAATVALALGVSKQTVLRRVAKNFRGLPHRLQLVRVIHVPRRQSQKLTQTVAEKIPRASASSPHLPPEHTVRYGRVAQTSDGQARSSAVMFYNDSASHNPHAAAAALRSFPGERKILIAGGKDRPADYAPLERAVRETDTDAVILFGENKKKIARALRRIENKGLRIKVVSNLKNAVASAYHFAQSSILNPQSSTVILLSPGAPSYDMFKNFEERGRAFVKYVRALKKQ